MQTPSGYSTQSDNKCSVGIVVCFLLRFDNFCVIFINFYVEKLLSFLFVYGIILGIEKLVTV